MVRRSKYRGAVLEPQLLDLALCAYLVPSYSVEKPVAILEATLTREGQYAQCCW